MKNVTVKDSYFKGNIFVGGVVGNNNGNITNCSNYGTVIGSSSSIGGVAGNNDNTITNCSNYGAVSRIITADDDPEAGISVLIGGVVGNNSATGEITNCSNSGTVSGTYDIAGGVVGNNNGNITNCSNSGAVTGSTAVGGVVGSNTRTIKNSSNTGTVSATQSQIGGVAGYHGDSGNITNCYNTGAVTGSDTYSCFVGGVVGFIVSGELTNCYNTGTVSGESFVGSVVGSNYNGNITNCYYLGTSETDDIDGTTYKTEAQFKSGEVAYLLQDGVKGGLLNDDEENPVYGEPPLVWGQISNKEGSLPILTSDEAYRVLPIMSGDTALAYTVLCKGDINNDAKVDVDDYQQIINISLSGNSKKTDADAYDLNGDGVINVLDCAIAKSEGISQDKYNLLLEAVNASETTLCYCKNADINGDGIVNILDCSLLELMLSGTVDTIG